MSHPNPSHDRENEYPSDDYKPTSKKKVAAKMAGVKGFGSEYNRKSLKRMLKKGKKYALKHF